MLNNSLASVSQVLGLLVWTFAGFVYSFKWVGKMKKVLACSGLLRVRVQTVEKVGAQAQVSIGEHVLPWEQRSQVKH